MTLARSACARQMGSMPMQAKSTNSYSGARRGGKNHSRPDPGTIHHQTIPGYMMEMTMDFPVKNTNELMAFRPAIKLRSRSS